MAYNKQTWKDGAQGGTPLSAARLNTIEDGIAGADTVASQAATTASTLASRIDALENRPASTGQATANAVTTSVHPRVAVLGDSHSDLTWTPQTGQTWWQIAVQAAGGIITEHGAQGHGGWTLRGLIDGAEGITPLDTALADKPDFLVIEGAANSASQGRTDAQYEVDLREIITRARAAGSSPVVVFPPALLEGETETWADRFTALHQVALDVCAALRVPIWDSWTKWPTSPAAWSANDEDHLNALGHAEFGVAAGEFLKTAFGAWSDLACVPLTDAPWLSTELSPWANGVAELVDPPTGSIIRGKAVRLYHPGASDDNAGVQAHVDVKAGTTYEVTCAWEITQGADDNVRHGLQLFWQRTDNWSLSAPVALIRHQGATGRGGFEFTVPSDYTVGSLVLAAALSAEAAGAPVEALVGNLVVKEKA